MSLKKNSALQEHLLRQERIVAHVSITGHATPASKVHAVDIPSVLILRTEGKTAEADAVENLTWTTAKDNDSGDSVFGILIDLGEDKADKVLAVSVKEVTALASSLAVTGPQATANAYLTPEGNIAIEVAGTGLDLSTESPTFLVDVTYREKR